MRLYRVTAKADFNGAPGRSLWTGSQAKVPGLKRQLADMAGAPIKRDAISVAEHDIPTNKEGLTDWLNKNMGGL